MDVFLAVQYEVSWKCYNLNLHQLAQFFRTYTL